MRSPGFQRFVAVFVGILVVLGLILSLTTQEESLLGTVLATAALYAVYLVIFFRREKQRKSSAPQSKKSPLIR